MRPRSIVQLVLLTAISVCATKLVTAQQASQKPLVRVFTAGTEERYQVTVAIRVETHGISTEKIGEKTYADSFTHEAAGQLSWRSSRNIVSLNADGSAALTESLDHFQSACDGNPGTKTFDANLQKSVQETCAAWQKLSEFSYQEEKFGLMRGLSEMAGGMLGPDSSLLPLWARRAFRPSVILPKGPLHFGERAAHRIENVSPARGKPEGEEAMEWVEAPGDTPAAMLHVTQNLSWIDVTDPAAPKNVANRPEPRHLFYSDSVNTISLLDGGLLKASRSATHETNNTLDPVPGLPDAPAFGSKLTITVTILRLP